MKMIRKVKVAVIEMPIIAFIDRKCRYEIIKIQLIDQELLHLII